MREQAERNEEGDLIYTEEVEVAPGAISERQVNVTHLFQTGPRKTRKLWILKYEAEQAADGNVPENPAKPINGDVAQDIVEWCNEEGVEPAWRVESEESGGI